MLVLKQIAVWRKTTSLGRARPPLRPTDDAYPQAPCTAEYPDPEQDPMLPHVIVLDPGLIILKIYNGYWSFGRPTIEELRQDLRAVLRKCRPAWDIPRPELKAAWKNGEPVRF